MKKNKGKLILVPTPIGNLKDITLRALEVLQNVDIIAAEDTRNSQFLLKHYDIKTPMISYHQHNEKKRSVELISELLKGKKIAIISDAGSPGISDPGQELVIQAINADIKIEALPGATAFIPAITSSGINSNRFCFIGFLPEKNKEKHALLERISLHPETLIFYVSPHDVNKFASDLYHSFNDRKICIGRELTKLYEEYIYCSLKELSEGMIDIKRKGEFVVIVAGKQEETLTEEKLTQIVKKLIDVEMPNKEIIDQVSKEYKIKPNRIKKLLYK